MGRFLSNKWCVICLLVLLGALAYATALQCGFVCDDSVIIQSNPSIRSLRNIPMLLTTEYWKSAEPNGTWTVGGGLYRGVTMTTFAIDHAVYGGLKPWGFHLTSVLLHIACSIVVYLVLLRALRNRHAAAFAAALFCVHPIHTEAVTGVSNRSEVLCAFFAMLGLLFFMRSLCTTSPADGDAGACGSDVALIEPPLRVSMLNQAAAMLFYGLALLSKESGVALPALCLMYAWLAHPGGTLRKALSRGPLLRYAGFAVVLAAYMLFRMKFVGGLGSGAQVSIFRDSVTGLEADISTRFFTMGVIFADYVRLMFYPLWQTGACIFSINPKAWYTSAGNPSVIISLVFLVAVVAGTFVIRRRSPLAVFWILWIFVTLAPASNIIPIGVGKGERLLYAPSVGFCAVMAIAFFAAHKACEKAGLSRGFRLRLFPAAAIGIVVCLGALAARRNFDWRDPLTFYTDIARKSPDNPFGYYARGAHYGDECNDVRKEIFNTTLALDIKPGYINALGRRASAYMKIGAIAEAARDLEALIALKPESWMGCNNLGVCRSKLGDYEGAAAMYTRAISMNPKLAGAYADRAWALQQLKRFKEAIEDYRSYREFYPEKPGAYYRIAECSYELGDYEEAKAALQIVEMLGNPVDEKLKRHIEEKLKSKSGPGDRPEK